MTSLQDSMRIAVLTNAPPPYRVPVFERLARAEDVDARFYFDGLGNPDDAIGDLPFASERIPARLALRRRGYQDDEHVTLRFGMSYARRLAAFRPDLVISGEFGWRTLHAAAYTSFANVPLLVWWEGTPFSDRLAGQARVGVRRWLAGRANGLLGFGRGAVRYLETLAKPGTPIHFVPQAVDNEHITREVDRWRADRSSLRASIGARGTVLLCVSRLVPPKGIRELLGAIRRLRAETQEGAFTVLLVGEGRLRPEAERAARELGGALRVIGNVAPSRLPRYLAASDLLLFPTLRDCWGMVVNEALAAGLPVLGSRYAGACEELILHDGVGLQFDPLDPASFDAALASAVVDGRFADGALAAARRAVAAHTCDAAAEALLAAARASLRRDDVPSLA